MCAAMARANTVSSRSSSSELFEQSSRAPMQRSPCRNGMNTAALEPSGAKKSRASLADRQVLAGTTTPGPALRMRGAQPKA
jgi:hypothetical protein